MKLMQLFRRGMSCSEVLEVLQTYLDGEIDADTARQVVAHLDRCEQCERESEVYSQIKVSLARHQPPVDPDILAALSRFGERVARGEVT